MLAARFTHVEQRDVFGEIGRRGDAGGAEALGTGDGERGLVEEQPDAVVAQRVPAADQNARQVGARVVAGQTVRTVHNFK